MSTYKCDVWLRHNHLSVFLMQPICSLFTICPIKQPQLPIMSGNTLQSNLFGSSSCNWLFSLMRKKVWINLLFSGAHSHFAFRDMWVSVWIVLKSSTLSTLTAIGTVYTFIYLISGFQCSFLLQISHWKFAAVSSDERIIAEMNEKCNPNTCQRTGLVFKNKMTACY